MPTALRAALANPVGLSILVLGGATAILVAALPFFASLAERAPWVLAAALLGYAGTTVVSAWPRREAREVYQVRRLRNAMADLRSVREASATGAPLADVLGDAVRHLDRELIPALARLVARAEALRAILARFQAGDLAAPDGESLCALQATEARLRDAISATQRQAANAYAATVALTEHDADDAQVVDEARRWAQRLRETEAALAGLLDESAAWDRLLDARSEQPRPAGQSPSPMPAATSVHAAQPNGAVRSSAASGAPVRPSSTNGADKLVVPLTAREREVAALIALGMTNRQIAEELVIAEGTAAIHVGNVLGKLGMSSRAQVAVWAAEHLPRRERSAR
jgi:DNA-binding NarL/FixJ family response regulator